MKRAVGLQLALLLLALSVPACSRFTHQASEETQEVEPEPAPSGAAHEEGASSEGSSDAKEEGSKEHEGEANDKQDSRPKRYAMPFVWETSAVEPLALTRAFLGEVLRDNQHNASRGAAAFKKFAEKQSPRVTVLTCADSRVQSDVWDETPENDDFTVRNIGNQLETSLGSVSYGVKELNTPVLMIVGHTGCGAVKAAMDHLKGLEGPVKKELLDLKLPELTGATETQLWSNAVIANVNRQVDQAVKEFADRIQEGNLTVIGAVYDFRNDLRGGPGKLHLVNVNANTEPERLKAFASAITRAEPIIPALDVAAPPSGGKLGSDSKLPGRSKLTSAE